MIGINASGVLPLHWRPLTMAAVPKVVPPRISVHRRLGSRPTADDHVAESEAPVDGGQPSKPKASLPTSNATSSPLTASVLLDIIDDLAALVIKPRFGEEEVIPEKLGFVFCMLGDVPVIPA